AGQRRRAPVAVAHCRRWRERWPHARYFPGAHRRPVARIHRARIHRARTFEQRAGQEPVAHRARAVGQQLQGQPDADSTAA
ncbi:MAG: hypothetical protein ACRDOL_34725, partial [Streptosporangiaceae bacterium]